MTRAQRAPRIESFSIRVRDDILDDLHWRIEKTRWPDASPGPAWEQGTDLRFLKQIVNYWAFEFDWRAQERELNSFHHYRAAVDGVRIHFVHEQAPAGGGIPLILTHGWPSAFIEYLPLVPLLTDPAAHGIDGPAFDLVIPSLPGYGFSERPARATYRSIGRMWHHLMRALGYHRYGAGGGDFGAGVATFMALDEPEAMVGIHLSNLELSPYLGKGSRALSESERAYLLDRQRWDDVERGYSAIQSTRPQTLTYGLNDSPVGLAAWILEKWRSWSGSKGYLGTRVSTDFLLTLLTLYWVTETITTSMRDYFDNRWHGATLGPKDRVRVPTGIATFTNQFAFEGDPPREWAERLYDVHQWTPMPRGGHFAPTEEPNLLARDIAKFFASL